MRATLLILPLLALAGCGPDDTDDDNNNNNVLPSTGGACEDSGCGGGGPQYLEPVAVGFEIDATLYDDGTLHAVRYSDGSTTPPFVRVTFADSDFFSLGSDLQEGHYCEIAGSLEYVTPQDSGDPAFGTQNGTILNWSYDFTLNLDLEFTGTECAGMVDPEVWGEQAELLLGPFQGAHVGIGFGPMTEYLWDQWGGADAPENADYVDKFFSMYVAINDRDGHWGGCDWTSALLFETDADDIAVEDPDAPGSLIILPVDNVGTGPLPKGYMRTFAYWYQDFPLMDFTNLGNDPVPSQSWLCQ